MPCACKPVWLPSIGEYYNSLVNSVDLSVRRARNRTKQSEKQFARLPANYVELRWTKLEALQLSHCIHLQEHLSLDRERLLSSLALLRSGTEVVGRRWSLDCIADDVIGPSTARPSIARGLLDVVHRLSSSLTKGLMLSCGGLHRD